MTMVEKLAAALWFDFVDQQGYPNELPTWDEMTANQGAFAQRLAHYRSLARAALSAMREPTEGMVIEVSEICDCPRLDAKLAIHAAIDAALAEGEG